MLLVKVNGPKCPDNYPNKEMFTDYLRGYTSQFKSDICQQVRGLGIKSKTTNVVFLPEAITLSNRILVEIIGEKIVNKEAYEKLLSVIESDIESFCRFSVNIDFPGIDFVYYATAD